MHNAALKACGLDMEYVRIHLRPPELEEGIGLLSRIGFAGVNLTIPHKTEIIPLLDSIDPNAEILGAVNTVRFENGKSRGYNTDGPGLVRAVMASFGARLGELRVMILGAGGGAGRAAAIQCAIEGCTEITLVNRTESKARALTDSLRELTKKKSVTHIRVVTDSSEILAHALADVDIILQCSALGMKEGDASPLPKQAIESRHFVYDTIYSRHTQLIKDAAEKGARCADGLNMLLHQGALAFEIWLERTAPVEVMSAALKAAIGR
jgi:shikimate dehydrogenase